MGQKETKSGKKEQEGQKLKIADRRQKVVDLYKSGANIRTIAAHLSDIGIKCSKSTVANDINAVFKELQESTQTQAEHLRTLQYMRLNSIILAFWKATIEGNTSAAYVVFKAISAINDLYGLSAAQKHEISGKDGKPIETVQISLEDWRKQAAERREQAAKTAEMFEKDE